MTARLNIFCSCLAECSCLQLYINKDRLGRSYITIDILIKHSKQFNQKRLRKLTNQFKLTVDELCRLIQYLEELSADYKNQSFVFIDKNETFILNIDSFKQFPNTGMHTESDCYTLVFYNNMKEYLKNKHSYDITLSQGMLLQFVDALKQIQLEVTSDILGLN